VDLPTVVSVHDLSVLLHPEWHPPQRVAAFERDFHRGLKQATRLLAISEFGKRQIVQHLGWPADRVSVTYMGVRPGLRRVSGDGMEQALQALKLAPGFLLHVGTLEPRKNLPTLLKAYGSLPAVVRERHPLVLIGGRGWNSDALHASLQGEAKNLNVRWVGYAKDEQVAALYSAARALVFPTFYEGFGMPTIEMMACGGAVLASTAEAIVETVGRKAHLIDPHDLDGWRDAMIRVCTDDDWWHSLRHNAEDTAGFFTWERCAKATLHAYRLTTGEIREVSVKKAAA
jgi:alpha-1,3-rhamnosyl/mannosyltransferase